MDQIILTKSRRVKNKISQHKPSYHMATDWCVLLDDLNTLCEENVNIILNGKFTANRIEVLIVKFMYEI